MKDLNERRAEFVYNAARLAAAAANAPIVPVLWEDREQPFKDQFLKVIERQCGPERSSSPEELHRSWMGAYIKMGWALTQRTDKDAVFVALCEIARLWIYDVEPR